MKESQAYLKAAQLIDSGKEIYSCNAILEVSENFRWADNYCQSMGFTGTSDFVEAHGFSVMRELNQAAQKHRVLLLLLASAIAESEGR